MDYQGYPWDGSGGGNIQAQIDAINANITTIDAQILVLQNQVDWLKKATAYIGNDQVTYLTGTTLTQITSYLSPLSGTNPLSWSASQVTEGTTVRATIVGGFLTSAPTNFRIYLANGFGERLTSNEDISIPTYLVETPVVITMTLTMSDRLEVFQKFRSVTQVSFGSGTGTFYSLVSHVGFITPQGIDFQLWAQWLDVGQRFYMRHFVMETIVF